MPQECAPLTDTNSVVGRRVCGGQFIRTLARDSDEGLDHNWVSCFGFRPDQAERLLQGWVQQAETLQWWSGCTLLAVQRKRDRIHFIDVRGTENDAEFMERCGLMAVIWAT